MAYQLEFEKLISYDMGEEGISLEVTFQLVGRSVKTPAKIDSGATYCIFERRFGEEIGLEIESGFRQRFGTATGGFLAYGHSVAFSVAGFDFDSMVFFAADESFAKNVLGRIGWLDKVVIGLVDYEGKLYLSKYGQQYLHPLF